MVESIPFARVQCDGNELKYVKQVLESGWLTTGPMCAKLESELAQSFGCKYAMAVSSCTAALHLAVDALGIGMGDKVIVPTLTFTATAEVLRYLGADPILVDVDYETRCITPEIIEQALIHHKDCKAVMVVHFAGQACAMLDDDREGIVSVCKRYGVRLVEDAAHALPARDIGQTVGAMGDVGCLSFYANKNITTGEGGMVLTNDEKLAEHISLMRLHGIDRTVWNRFTDANTKWEYDVVAAGYKYNLADLNAAVGLAQCENVIEMHQRRIDIAARYQKELVDLPLDLPVVRGPHEDHSWHLFNVIVKPESRLNRNELIETLSREGIGLSVHYKPLHRMTYYQQRYDLSPEMFSVAESIWRGTVSLPIYPSLQFDEQTRVIERLNHCLR